MRFKNLARSALYGRLLDLRKRNPALATDAPFRKVSVGDDKALYAYLREKGKDKVLVILNLSNKEQTITIKDNALVGSPMNLFLGAKEPFTLNHSFNIEPWGILFVSTKPSQYIIGVDIGTTNTKAIAITPEGVILAQANLTYSPLASDAGVHELDPEPLFNAIVQTIHTVCSQVGHLLYWPLPSAVPCTAC